MLGKLFSGGAAELIKGVGGVIDNLHTSAEEKLAAEQKIKDALNLLHGIDKRKKSQITDDEVELIQFIGKTIG